jgi:hypothetical protein
MRYLKYLLLAALASTLGFIVHVFTVEWLQPWISQKMANHSVIPSWDVRYFAMLTSIEYGIATILLYRLMRDKVIVHGKLKASLLLSVLLLGLHGALIRQPLMDVLVGSPLDVALLQNAFKWLTWILISVTVVYGSESIDGKKNRLP